MGQRWSYRVGETTIHVDNAFDAWGHGNERLLVDRMTHGQATSWMKRQTTLAVPVGDRSFKALVKGGLVRMSCDATLDGEPILPVAVLETQWRGDQDSWPAEDAWQAEGWIAKRPR